MNYFSGRRFRQRSGSRDQVVSSSSLLDWISSLLIQRGQISRPEHRHSFQILITFDHLNRSQIKIVITITNSRVQTQPSFPLFNPTEPPLNPIYFNTPKTEFSLRSDNNMAKNKWSKHQDLYWRKWHHPSSNSVLAPVWLVGSMSLLKENSSTLRR